MSIDWFTVVAQIVNFLVLVALMKHFFYRRLMDAIDAREQHVANQLAEADRKSQEATKDLDKARADFEEIERQRGQMLRDAQHQADQEHTEMTQQALAAVKAQETQWREDLDREKAIFFDQVRARAVAEILSIARRALDDLACADLQKCALDSFLDNLPALHGDLHGELVVRSAVELAPEVRNRVEETIRQQSGVETQVRFECTPKMAWGVELCANGTRVGWNPDNYVRELEENLRHAFTQGTGTTT